jgi:hypothetical protein
MPTEIATTFPLGQVVATASLIHAMVNDGLDAEPVILDILKRHASGDWGDLDKFDKLANDAAVLSGHDRILSRYNLHTPVSEISVYIITEWDRSSTCVMRVEDY